MSIRPIYDAVAGLGRRLAVGAIASACLWTAGPASAAPPASPAACASKAQPYTVRRDATLSALAKAKKADLDAVLKANPNLRGSDVLLAGQRICLPATGRNQQKAKRANHKTQTEIQATTTTPSTVVTRGEPRQGQTAEFATESGDGLSAGLAILMVAAGLIVGLSLGAAGATLLRARRPGPSHDATSSPAGDERFPSGTVDAHSETLAPSTDAPHTSTDVPRVMLLVRPRGTVPGTGIALSRLGPRGYVLLDRDFAVLADSLDDVVIEPGQNVAIITDPSLLKPQRRDPA